MKNLLRLHEAVAVILLKEPNRTASFETIANKIDKRNLFPRRKKGISLAEQIKLRTSIASSKYRDLFEFKPPETISLK
jgi:hypothetical protein